ncbi:MAG: hypothetical protein Q6364_04635 [Candidatus Hermodarchaeota archaeon]|nr:hypothetical protein [Candidatus Hermodarchaeota archaeon]
MHSSTRIFPAPRKGATHQQDRPQPQSRTRAIILIIIGLAIFIGILYGVTTVASLTGNQQLAMGLLLITSIIFWVSLGVGLMLGLTYFVMHTVMKHEFKRRYDRSHESQRNRIRRMRIRNEPDEESG